MKICTDCEKMANLIPNSKCKLISATGHTIHVEDSDEFDTMILGFFKGGAK